MCKDKYKYLSTDVAIYIVALANKERYIITLTKAMKLLYIVYGSYLSVTKEKLCESPEAWPFGPVFPVARKVLLDKKLEEITMEDVSKELKRDDLLKNIIDATLSTFGGYDSEELTDFSMAKGTPWFKVTRNIRGVDWGRNIPDNDTSSFFGRLVVEDRENKNTVSC
jgi:uncharacterized phage-associated protein